MLKKLLSTVVSGLALLALVTGCTAPSTQSVNKPADQPAPQPATQAETVATINGDPVTVEDMEFYGLINRIQIVTYKEHDQTVFKGAELERIMKLWETREQEALHPNTLLTQIIRLRAMDLLGKEKGHKATPEEVEKEVQKVKDSYAKSPTIQAMIKEYGEEKFWDKQKAQYQKIVVVNKVQQDVIAKVKEANPKAEMKEINVLAEKQYEELLVSQVGTLQIKITSKNS